MTRLQRLFCVVSISLACTDDGGETDADTSTTDTATSTEESGETNADTSTADDTSSTDTESGESDASENESSESDTSDATATDTGALECEDILAEYDALIGMRTCSVDEDCKIVEGHCYAGIGGCYHAVSIDIDEAQLGALADDYEAAGCTSGVCDCPPPPTEVSCDAGLCEAIYE
ncbi:hypothetical protein G6O69_20040 [Pseudenhygromyxa sp. WMMC2535]|uniref:hypothetical protein n=1 Tax=Pseudenhygromyxa sp. WMMC2535 TaxID=2712867 RepID=UPI00155444F1|nr:hypothetical protein [Pseudenhygromyxa sp. WMMC2535]NVB40148.1 hypothetical protein [Pseudenhygromyxa sp. WMMC2535]